VIDNSRLLGIVSASVREPKISSETGGPGRTALAPITDYRLLLTGEEASVHSALMWPAPPALYGPSCGPQIVDELSHGDVAHLRAFNP
jgi:hypothetical protein